MNSSPVSAPDFYAAVSDAHIDTLKKQRDALLAKVKLLSAIVRQVPTMLHSARMDQQEGKPTVYDYKKASRALNAPETY